jgi:GT2 family glycosyltransferase
MLEDKDYQIHRFSQIAPLVSVIVVNFNGKPYLGPFLESLMQQTYPKYEIIVVDNGSADGSASFIRDNFPHVRLICSEKNLGFTGGNNLGMRAARGRLYALINNDTVVEPDWLYYLVSEMESDSKIGAVGSKIIFFKPYLNFTIDLPTFCPAKMGGLSDHRNLGLLMDENSGIDGCSYHKPVFCAGFYNPEYINEMVVRWTMGHAEFMFPVDRKDGDAALRLVVAGGKENSGSRFSVKLDGELLGERTLGKDFAEFLFNIPVKKVQEKSFYLLNNAASFLDGKGNAGDRGIYQPDRGQFDESEDVEALCGCSMLIRKEALQKIGYFDEDFFMYYEDTDLSWRMRRHGFRLRYQPLSVVNHIHAGTSREGSSVFIFYVTRNRILMTLKNASLKDNVIIFLVECGQNLRLAYRWLRAIKDGPIAAQIGKELKIRLRVYLSLFKLAPRMILKRLRLISN